MGSREYGKKVRASGHCWLEVKLRRVFPAVGSQWRFFSRGGEVTKAVLEKEDFGDGVEEGVMVSGRYVAERAKSMSSPQAAGMRVSAQEGEQRWRDVWSWLSF